MNINDVTTVVVGIVTIYLLWQQNRIFRNQNDIFAAQAGNSAMPIRDSRLPRLQRYWPMLAMGTLALLTWGAVGYDYYDRHNGREIVVPAPQAWNDLLNKRQLVANRSFSYEDVHLDGHTYYNCTFTHVTFWYDGTSPGEIQQSKVDTDSMMHLSTNNPSIAGVITLLKAFGFVNGEIRVSVGDQK